MKDIYEWLEYGQKQGWISADYCTTHGWPPMTFEEETLEEEWGEPPCIHAVRLYAEGDDPREVDRDDSKRLRSVGRHMPDVS